MVLPAYHVRILATAPSDFFSIDKILPWRNCLRAQEEANDHKALPSTPFYNATLGLEMSVVSYSSTLSQAQAIAQGFPEASALAALWLRQHAFDSSISRGGFGAFESSIMMAMLLQKGGPKDSPLINANCSPLQLFKALLRFLAGRDLVQSPLALNINHTKMRQMPRKFPIFFDGTRGVNLLFKMTEWSYARVSEPSMFCDKLTHILAPA